MLVKNDDIYGKHLNMVVFTRRYTSTSTENIYTSEFIEITINSQKYNYSLTIKEKTEGLTAHIRMETVQKVGKNGEKSRVGIGVYKDVFKHVMYQMMTFEAQYLLKKKTLNNDRVFALDTSKKMSLIPDNLNETEIHNIVSVKSNRDIILKHGLIQEFKDFCRKWDELIKIDALEIEFQKLFNEYPNVISFIFPRCPSKLKFESLIRDEWHDNNKIDIYTESLTKDIFLVELKRPTTNLFAKSGGRNNIASITKEFANASMQITLYNAREKMQQRKVSDPLIYGILIIGTNSQIKTAEQKTAWKLLRQEWSSDIYTYDDISIIARSILEKLSN